MENNVQKHNDAANRSEGPPSYLAPAIQSFSPEEFLDLLGPAQGYGGGGGGGRGPHLGDSGSGFRPQRMFPGLR